MAKKSRVPQQLGNADYGKWYEQIVDFKADEEAAGTWPSHLTADLALLGAVMWDAWDDYDRLQNELYKTVSKAYDNAAKPVMDRLQSLRELIPTLFGGDDAVLGEFGIKREIPSDKEDLFTVASGCLEHWNDITDPAVPPEYLPVAPMFTEFQLEYDAFQTAYTAYIDKTREKEDAQNLFEEKRAACHDAERLVFHWYKGLHMDGEDEWWTATPWGTVSGGGEEPGGGGTSWRDKPVATMTIVEDPMHGIILGCEEYSGTDRFDMRVAWALVGEIAPPMPEEDYTTDVEEPVFLGIEYLPGYVYYGWIRARKEGEVSEWSELASVEWTG